MIAKQASLGAERPHHEYRSQFPGYLNKGVTTAVAKPIQTSSGACSLVTPGRLEATRVTAEPGFDGLRSEWNAVVDQMEDASPFQTWEWNRTWWKYFGRPDTLEILVFREAGRVVGIAPFYRRTHLLGPWKISSLVPIGGTRHELTEQWELLFPPAYRPQLFEALAKWLNQSPWSIVRIPGLRDSDWLPSWLEDRVVERATVTTEVRSLPDTWEGFLTGLNKSMRDNVKYYPGLLRRNGEPYYCAIAATPLAVMHSVSVFLGLHQARAQWRTASRHHDKFLTPERRAFIREVAPLLAARRELRIHMLRIGGEIVAAELWMEHGDTMFAYRSGYSAEWSRYSVAMVNTAEAIKDGIGRGMRTLDLLRGSGQFKERWGTRPRHRSEVIVGRHPRVVKALLRTRDVHRRFRHSATPRARAAVNR